MLNSLPRLWRRSRRHLIRLTKVGFTVALLVLLFRFVDWTEVGARLRRVDLVLAGLVLLLRFGGIALSAYKWKRILAIQRISYSFGQLHRWYLTGYFVSQFLPTGIGGDGYRIYKTWNNEQARSSAVFAVAVERVTGMLALLLIGYGAATVMLALGDDPLVKAIFVGGSVTICASLVAGLFLWRSNLLGRLTRSPRTPRLLLTFLQFVHSFRLQPRESLVIVLLSFAFHLNRVVALWVLILSFGVAWNVLEVGILLAVKDIVAMVPITVGGLGLVDGTFVYLLSYFGLEPEIALSTMIMLRVHLVVVLLPGAYFYLIGGERVREERVTGAAV